jgi:fatty acid desaturase
MFHGVRKEADRKQRRYPLTNPSKPKLGDLKRAIPEDCFQPSTLISISYIARDITFATALIYLALHIQYLSTPSGRFVAWTCYGFLQGCVGTGIWILAHECGHGALFPHRILNNTVGWILHSILLVPYFSWQISHAQHHRYTGHMEKDTVFVPHTKAEYASKLKANVERLKDLAEDTPLLTASQLLLHQLFGWQAYLLWSVSAGNNFGGRGSKTQKWQNTSHFLPSSMHFLPSHFSLVLLSDFGLGLVWYALWVSAGKTDWYTVTLIYGVPYLWVNHWLGKTALPSPRTHTKFSTSQLQSPSSTTPIPKSPTTLLHDGRSSKEHWAPSIETLDSSADSSSTASSTRTSCITSSPRSLSTKPRKQHEPSSHC